LKAENQMRRNNVAKLGHKSARYFRRKKEGKSYIEEKNYLFPFYS
jgi:hypothetical protein